MKLCKVLFFAITLSGFTTATERPKPKLVVAIVIDQFRHDYLTRFRSQYHGGLDYLLKNGANFSSSYYAQIPTVTAVGHSIFLSRAMPTVSGMVGNSWYDRDEKRVVTSVCDWRYKTVGGEEAPKGVNCTDADPASPMRLLVTTLGDELRNAHEESKVVGVSIKARGAILPSGHRALGAFWFDDTTGNFVTSSFYMDNLPAWASAFNSEKRAAKYVNEKWPAFPDNDFHAPPGRDPYSMLPASPWGNELIEQFAEEAVKGEKLGQRDATDLLTVSFSSNDYVGHAVGPDAPEVRDMAIRVDEQIGKLFKMLDETVGMKNVLVVLTADHGVAPTAEIDEQRKIPGGHLLADAQDTAQSALARKFGKGDWFIPGGGEAVFYLNEETVAKFKAPISDINQTVSDALLAVRQLHVARVYSRKQLMNGVAGDFIATAAMNGFNPGRSGDFFLIYEPNYIPGTSGTSHFSPYGNDRHVPLLFAGPGIESGEFDESVVVNDVAPTPGEHAGT
jgi:arylsulfatase A-like enzyme